MSFVQPCACAVSGVMYSICVTQGRLSMFGSGEQGEQFMEGHDEGPAVCENTVGFLEIDSAFSSPFTHACEQLYWHLQSVPK